MLRRSVLAGLVLLLLVAGTAQAALLQGGPRNERITGTKKSDRIIAGKGNDVVFARNGVVDRVNCGPGIDRAVLDRFDHRAGCDVQRFFPTDRKVVPPIKVSSHLIPYASPAIRIGRPGTITLLRKPPPEIIPPVLPPPVPTIPPGADLFGLVANADHLNAIDSAARVGAKLLRMEWGLGTPVSVLSNEIAIARAKGIEVIPQVGFDSGIPSTTESKTVKAWADGLAGRIRYIEFGNEEGFSYKGTQGRGADYGRSAQALCETMALTGVGLLVQADDGNTGSGWVRSMLQAAPLLRACSAGWVIHPYGPRSSWEGRIGRSLAELRGEGVPLPRVFVSEWGVASDNGATLSDNYGFPKNLTYQQAGDLIRTNVDQMFARFPEIFLFTYFQAHDQQPSGTGEREHYFGALRSDRSDKVGLTDDIRALAAAHG